MKFGFRILHIMPLNMKKNIKLMIGPNIVFYKNEQSIYSKIPKFHFFHDDYIPQKYALWIEDIRENIQEEC